MFALSGKHFVGLNANVKLVYSVPEGFKFGEQVGGGHRAGVFTGENGVRFGEGRARTRKFAFVEGEGRLKFF